MRKVTNNLKALREDEGITHAELLRRVSKIMPGEISYVDLYNWENGVCNPRLGKAYLLCEVFDCSLDKFFNITEGE